MVPMVIAAAAAMGCGARSWLGEGNLEPLDASTHDAAPLDGSAADQTQSDTANGDAFDVARDGPSTAAPFALDVVGGGYHTCARLMDGTVRCWGENELGELGNGTSANASTPVPVSNLTGVTALALGPNHTCAVVAGGTVACWGDNAYGQLGDGTTHRSYVPVAVRGLAGAVALALGERHSCAALSDGSVVCWGNNDLGQIGTGATGCCTCVALPDSGPCPTGYLPGGQCDMGGDPACTRVAQPTAVSVPRSSRITALSAGLAHTCGLVSGSGMILCWGTNPYGQLGNGRQDTEGPDASVDPGPNLVSGLAGATTVAAGAEHVCALLSDGTVACWGANSSGQLGNGTTTNSLVPVVVPHLSGVKGLASASGHTCAVVTGGSVECWGTNDAYQLGNDMIDLAACGGLECSSTPVVVVGLRNAIALGGGSEHTCAVLDDGTVWCWGLNIYGQVGDGTLTSTSAPVAVVW